MIMYKEDTRDYLLKLDAYCGSAVYAEEPAAA